MTEVEVKNIVTVYYGSSRQIPTNNNFKHVVQECRLIKIPIIIVSFNKEIQVVHAFYPADFDIYVKIILVILKIVDYIFELIQADSIVIRYDIPVRCIAVDTGNHMGRKLKDLKFNIRSFESISLRNKGKNNQNNGENRFQHFLPSLFGIM